MIIEKIPRIIKNKKKIEKKLNIKIQNRGKEVIIEGEPEEEYTAEKILESIEFGFPLSVSFLIKEQDYVFETINIKDFTKRKDLKTIKARIIGKKGKTLKTLQELTDCFFEIKENKVGIIGDPEKIKNAIDGLTSIIKGSKQSNVYSYLEKHHPKEIIDWGLKK